MYLIIILECVKSSLDNNILRKYVFFFKDVMTADVAELECSNNKGPFGLRREGGGVEERRRVE